MNNLFPASLIPLFTLAFTLDLGAETWTVESADEWKSSIESSEGITIEKGVASPTAKAGSLRTKIKTFKDKQLGRAPDNIRQTVGLDLQARSG